MDQEPNAQTTSPPAPPPPPPHTHTHTTLTVFEVADLSVFLFQVLADFLHRFAEGHGLSDCIDQLSGRDVSSPNVVALEEVIDKINRTRWTCVNCTTATSIAWRP